MQPMVGLPMPRAAGGASGPRSTPCSEGRLGQRTRRVEDATALAAAHPMLGSPWKLRTRRVFAKGFPFSVVYRIEPTELVVFAIANFRRRPSYCRRRK